MGASGQASPSTMGPFGHYCPVQGCVSGADISANKPGLHLKGSIFSLVL